MLPSHPAIRSEENGRIGLWETPTTSLCLGYLIRFHRSGMLRGVCGICSGYGFQSVIQLSFRLCFWRGGILSEYSWELSILGVGGVELCSFPLPVRIPGIVVRQLPRVERALGFCSPALFNGSFFRGQRSEDRRISLSWRNEPRRLLRRLGLNREVFHIHPCEFRHTLRGRNFTREDNGRPDTRSRSCRVGSRSSVCRGWSAKCSREHRRVHTGNRSTKPGRRRGDFPRPIDTNRRIYRPTGPLARFRVLRRHLYWFESFLEFSLRCLLLAIGSARPMTSDGLTTPAFHPYCGITTCVA